MFSVRDWRDRNPAERNKDSPQRHRDAEKKDTEERG